MASQNLDHPNKNMALSKKLNSSSEDWYLASCKPRQETRALENLENQEVIAFLPTLSVEKVLAGRKQVVSEPLFKGYLFINIQPEDPQWPKIRSTRGIRDWVRFAGKPAKIPKSLIEQLWQQEIEPQLKLVEKRFNKGQTIRIMSGPFEGLNGIFESDDGDLRSMILIEFLGKTNRISVGNEQIVTD
ncbi:MAG: transcription/translation regulatory transformer protein RfaH [Kangiellaceae bacterium]|nr:transcription/translation regulatory transformer protein RfaH [Kangiellaceae bacterium]MCW8999990.1 transcription/translation regulatory transformer protein RfaH [Kangiellaceae bacterium]MCW9016611.1 transcription/translation regulatory transformer protein RfaH [Kangiellaceae bacterium]